MVVFKKKFYFFEVTEMWFKYYYSLKYFFTLRSFSFIQYPINVSFFYGKEVTYTLELSLLKSEEEMLSGFSATTKNEINKAKNISIKTKYLNDIDLFVSIYNDFAGLKNIYPIRRNTLASLSGNLQISFAYYDNSPVVVHAYIIEPESGIVRLYLSGSKRLNNQSNKKIISYANKLLMYEDMIYFKKNKFKTYDFGGYALNTNNKSLEGINQFKQSFGGILKECISYYTPLYFLLRKISQKIDRRYS